MGNLQRWGRGDITNLREIYDKNGFVYHFKIENIVDKGSLFSKTQTIFNFHLKKFVSQILSDFCKMEVPDYDLTVDKSPFLFA